MQLREIVQGDTENYHRPDTRIPRCIFDVVFLLRYLGDARFLRTEHFSYAKIRGDTNFRHKFVKHAINWITLRSDYHSEVSLA